MLYSHFAFICGDLPMIPFIWFITLQNRNILFCVFLSFRDLTELKWTSAFSGIDIFANGAD